MRAGSEVNHCPELLLGNRVEFIHLCASVWRMKYILLVYRSELPEMTPSTAEPTSERQRYADFVRAAGDQGVLLGYHLLMPVQSATTVHLGAVSNRMIPGPARQGGLQLSASFIVACAHIDEAADWAARIPDAHEGAVEIRPLASA